MIRSMGLLVVAAGLTLSACGSSEKKKSDSATFTAAPDQQALLGTWSDGATTLNLNSNMNYTMELSREGRNTTATSGKWQLRGGAIYLTPQGQMDEVYDFSWGSEQRSLSLTTAKGGSWNLVKR